MKKRAAFLGVGIWGLVTGACLAWLNAALAGKWGFNLYSLSFFHILPLGAFICGLVLALVIFAAASVRNQRATPALGWQIVVIAGFTHSMTHWLRYQDLALADGARLADAATFAQYLQWSVTSAHFTLKGNDYGEVGAFGYLLEVVQFGGLLLGALLSYLTLQAKAACEPCDLYMTPLGSTRTRVFEDRDHADGYYADVPLATPGSAQFAALMTSETGLSEEEGTFLIETELIGCPACRTQALRESVKTHDGKRWKHDTTLDRVILLPPGADVAKLFAH